MGYTLLGIIIESVTNQRYETYLDQNVLKSLGMSNSTFHFTSQIGKNADKKLAMGHFDNGKTTTAQPIYLRPAGQITTTAYDMGLFLNFVMSNGRIGEQKFVDEKYLQNIGVQNYTEAFEKGLPFGYALGAYTRDRHGVIGTSVIGNILGFAARLYWFPKQKKAFFIAHNMDSETADYEVFNAILIKHLKIENETRKIKILNTTDEISQYGGYYLPIITKVEPFRILDKIFSFTKVEILHDGVLLNPMQKKSQKLDYVGKNLFSSDGRTTISHAFYKNDNNDLMITDGISTVRKVNGWSMATTAVAFLLGIMSIILSLIIGAFQLIKHKKTIDLQPYFWILCSIFLLILSVINLFFGTFIEIGNPSYSNYFLAFSSALLPLAVGFAMFKKLINFKSELRNLSFWVILSCVPLLILLIINDILPVRLWV